MIAPWTYIVGHESWYWAASNFDKNLVAEVTIEGPGDIEVMMKWFDMGSHRDAPCPRIAVFDESWAIFALLPDLFSALAEHAPHSDRDPKMGPSQFTELLDSLGFIDETVREVPEGIITEPLTIEKRLAMATLALESIQATAEGVEGSLDYQECTFAAREIGGAASEALGRIR